MCLRGGDSRGYERQLDTFENKVKGELLLKTQTSQATFIVLTGGTLFMLESCSTISKLGFKL